MTNREIKQIFRNQLRATIGQLRWVEAAPNDKIMANRISLLPRGIRELIVKELMPTGVRDSINKRYPKRMVANV